MTNTRPQGRREAPGADVFARTVPFIYERHYFHEHRKASLATVETPTEKRLLALRKRVIEMPETAAIRLLDTRFREFVQANATPFRPGFYLVPLPLVERVEAEARSWEVRRGELADRAAVAYPAQLELMRGPLGPQFNLLDYPSAPRFRAAFWVDWRFINFGVPNVLREIRAEIFEREREKLARAGAKAQDLIEQHLATTLYEITEHLSLLLKPKAGGRMPALREGALDGLLQYLDTISMRDVTGFRELQAVTRRLRAATEGVDIEQLRDDDALRARVAAVVDEAKREVGLLVVDDDQREVLLRE